MTSVRELEHQHQHQHQERETPGLPSQRDSSIRGVKPVHAHLEARVWHVCIQGGESVGPVSADQLARGIRAGKVPSDARVRHATDTFWSDLLDAPDVVAALKAVTAESQPPPSPLLKQRLTAPEYLVWVDGSEPVGPVSADQIARGIRAGKVPPDASLQRVGDFFARDVLDEPDVIEALKNV